LSEDRTDQIRNRLLRGEIIENPVIKEGEDDIFLLREYIHRVECDVARLEGANEAQRDFVNSFLQDQISTLEKEIVGLRRRLDTLEKRSLSTITREL
jgi:hypothetical protein